MAIGFALHGGAFTEPLERRDDVLTHMGEVARCGVERLSKGDPALDVVTEAIVSLEDSGLYLAGRGAAPNSEGEFELDASIMDGMTRQGGGVAGLRGIRNPIRAARLVMEKTPHVLVIGDGARRFAERHDLERIEDPAGWFRPAALVDSTLPLGLGLGTVGVVALDQEGRLAAGTSTGGTLGKLQGRVGDTPLIGAGTWADQGVAVSCTGQGEYFIRAAVAADIAARLRYAGEPLESAAGSALADMSRLGGHGGLIALDRDGRVAMPFNTRGLKRAWLTEDAEIALGLE